MTTLTPALAQTSGGAGGLGGDGFVSNGGSGGLTGSGGGGGGDLYNGGASVQTGAGGAGGNQGGTQGGGGGGAGEPVGGAGGVSTNGGSGGAGGMHGTVAAGLPGAASNGGAGGAGSNAPATISDGGGGGAGGFGAVVTGNLAAQALAGTITGGAGGAGGSQLNGGGGTVGDGGGGGGGGLGLLTQGTVTGLTIGQIITGGAGGAAGSSSASIGNGGGGGGGGAGVVFLQPATGVVVNAAVTGGAGGSGGNSAAGLFLGAGGGGGGGGVGMAFDAGGSVTINSAVAGGTGGAAGTGNTPQAAGVGGVGITGSGLAITLGAVGTISGGLSSAGAQANAINFTGGTNVVSFGAATSGLTGGINIATGATAQLNGVAGGFGTTVSNVISGGGGLIQNSANTLALTGANTYSGGTSLNAGVLVLGNDSALGTGTLTTANGTIVRAIAPLTFANNVVLGAGATSFDTNGNSFATIGNFTGVGGLTKTGGGTFTLSGANAYLGATTVTAGVMAAGAANTFSSSSAVDLQNTAQLDLRGFSQTIGSLSGVVGTSVGSSIAGAATLTTGGDNSSTTFAGVILDGAGTMALAKAGAGTFTLTGANSYSGGTTITSGTLSVSADNNLGASTGGLTFNGGTLQTTGTFVTTRGVVTAGAGTLSQSALANLTLNGQLSGFGTLTKNGQGTLTLGPALDTSGYFGGMTLASGTLSLQSNLAASFGTITTTGSVIDYGNGITNAAALNINSNTTQLQVLAGTATQSGVISETGGSRPLEKIGAGTLILSGANTYTGPTTISAGAINIQNANALGTTAGGTTVAAGTALQLQTNFTTGEALTLNGTGIANDGALRSVSGNNGVTGVITLGSATRINTDGAGMVLSGGITGAGQNVTFGGAGLTTVSGNIATGTGTLTKDGAGNLALQGTNTYTGVTTINAGTLFLIGGAAIADTGAIVVNAPGSLTVTAGPESIGSLAGGGNVALNNNSTTLITGNNNTSTTMSGVVSGLGSLTKAGTGTFTLAGTNTYTGATTVNGGTLAVNGSIATSSMTTVNAGATLGGTGTVGNTTIAAGGFLAPGNSIGTLNVQGNLVLNAASTYMVEVNPTSADRTNVTGTANLGGAGVNANFAPGSYVARQYTIVNATGGLGGSTFGAQVNTNLPSGFNSSLSYDANNAYLNLALNFVPPVVPGFGNGLSGNQTNVANALVNSFNTAGGIPLVFGALTPQGLTQVSGEAATGSQQTTFNAMGQFLGVLTDPFMGTRTGGAGSAGASAYADESEALAYAQSRKRNPNDALAAIHTKAPVRPTLIERLWSVWGAGYGGTQSTGGNAVAGSSDTRSRVYGAAAGVDYRLTPNTVVGFSLGGAGTNFSVANALGTGRSEMFQAGVYGRHTAGAAYISGALAYGWQDVTTDRNVFGNAYRANFNADSLSARVEGGWRFATSATSGLTPYAAGQVTSFWLPQYAEQTIGGVNTFALAYNAKDVTASRSELGLRGDTSFAMQDAILTLRGRAAWAHNFDTDRSINAIFQTLPASGFTVNGAMQARDAALLSAGGEIRWASGFSIAGTFEGEFSRNVDSYAGKGVVRYQW